MKRINFLFFIAIFCTNIFPSAGQDIKNDLQKIKDKYEKRQFSATIKYSYYSGNTLDEELVATCLSDKSSFYFKIDQMEIIENKKFQMVVNHQFKSVSVLPNSTGNLYSSNLKLPIDSALKDVKSYLFSKGTNGDGKYTIELKKGTYKKVEVQFNLTTFNIIKAKFYVSDEYAAADSDMKDGVLEVEYISFSEKINEQDKKLLSEKRFIKFKSGNKMSLVPEYNSYELNNYLETK